jgi:hypothetical protein
MNIKDSTDFFNSLVSQTDKKSERKIYNCFIGTLTSLNEKDLTEKHLQSIQEKLSVLNLNVNVGNRKKYYKRKLSEFKAFLKDEFSFTSAKYYTEIWMIYGMIYGTGIGLSIGIAINPSLGASIGLSIGTGVGMVFGMLIGARKDAEAKRQGKVI